MARDPHAVSVDRGFSTSPIVIIKDEGGIVKYKWQEYLNSYFSLQKKKYNPYDYLVIAVSLQHILD